MKFDINDMDSIIEWEKNKVIDHTILDDGRYLSTVCIPPIGMNEEFETMLFDNQDNMNELGCWRWNNRDEAAKGHRDILEELKHEILTIELSGLGVVNE